MKYLHKGSSAVENAPPKKKTLKRWLNSDKELIYLSTVS